MIDWDNEMELFNAMKRAVVHHMETGERMEVWYTASGQGIVDEVWVQAKGSSKFDLPGDAVLWGCSRCSHGTAWNGAFYFTPVVK